MLRINVRKSRCRRCRVIRTALHIFPILHRRWANTFWSWMKSMVWLEMQIEVAYKSWSRWSNDHAYPSSASAMTDNIRRSVPWPVIVMIYDSIVRMFNRFGQLCWLFSTVRTSWISNKKHWIILFNLAIKISDRRFIRWTSGLVKEAELSAKQPIWSRRMSTTIRSNSADCPSRMSYVRNPSLRRAICSFKIINWCLYWSKRIIFNVNLICPHPRTRRENWQISNNWILFPLQPRVSHWEIFAHRWFLVKTIVGHYCPIR